MTTWSKARISQYIDDQIEEGLQLEYKAAAALNKQNNYCDEITKDISAMANSTGGLLIYGIAEYQDKQKKHLPEKLDPIDRTQFTKEWLEQIIQTIQPRIDNVVIHPIDDEKSGYGFYVVEVPQSGTAHQARDGRYYKRHNFNAIHMEDYEIRDVMGREKHPQLEASIYINQAFDQIHIKIQNVGGIKANHYAVNLKLPCNLGIIPEKPSIFKEDTDGTCFECKIWPTSDNRPLFPSDHEILVKDYRFNPVPLEQARLDRSITTMKVTIFADEMPPIKAALPPNDVLKAWTPIK